MGDVIIKRIDGAPVSGYVRTLSFDEAAAEVKFYENGEYSRKMFISKPHDIMIIDITADNPISLSVTADSRLLCEKSEKDNFCMFWAERRQEQIKPLFQTIVFGLVLS